jgi:hypothetical protein
MFKLLLNEKLPSFFPVRGCMFTIYTFFGGKESET